MAVLENERSTATRSALRYRPIDTDSSGPVPAVTRQRRSRPDVRTAAAPVEPDDLDLEEEKQPPRRRSDLPAVPRKKSTPPVHARRQAHPLFFIGLGLLAMVLLWIGLSQAIIWGTNEYNTLVYGYPRTFQVDAVVGQGDSLQHPSHFLAINLHGTVTIIAFPGGDPSRARELVSSSLLGPGGDLAVVTLRFVDLAHNGKPDMIIDVGGVQSVLVNDGQTFRVPTPAEQQHLLQEIQQK